MALTIEWVLIDCIDLDVMSEFWCQALELEHVGTGPSGGYRLAAADDSGRLRVVVQRSRLRFPI